MFTETGEIQKGKIFKRAGLASFSLVGLGLGGHSQFQDLFGKNTPDTVIAESNFNRLNSIFNYFKSQILSPNFAIKSNSTPSVEISHNMVSILGYDENQTEITSTSANGTTVFKIYYRTPVIFGKTDVPKGFNPDRSSINIQVDPGKSNPQFEYMKKEGATSFSIASFSKTPTGVWNIQWEGQNIVGSENFPTSYNINVGPNSGNFTGKNQYYFNESLSKINSLIEYSREGASLKSFGDLEFFSQ